MIHSQQSAHPISNKRESGIIVFIKNNPEILVNLAEFALQKKKQQQQKQNKKTEDHLICAILGHGIMAHTCMPWPLSQSKPWNYNIK